MEDRIISIDRKTFKNILDKANRINATKSNFDVYIEETIHIQEKDLFDLFWEGHEIKEYEDSLFDDKYYDLLGDKTKGKEYGDWILENFSFKTLLEIGPGNCGFLEYLKDNKKEVIGVEYSNFAIDKFKSPVKIINAPVWNMSVLEKPFDIVWCLSVLQLIPMDKREDAVKEISRLTNSYAIIVIPHMPQKPIIGEEWIVSPKVYEANKDKYKTLVRLETEEYWLDLFKKHGLKQLQSKIEMPRDVLSYWLFEK